MGFIGDIFRLVGSLLKLVFRILKFIFFKLKWGVLAILLPYQLMDKEKQRNDNYERRTKKVEDSNDIL